MLCPELRSHRRLRTRAQRGLDKACAEDRNIAIKHASTRSPKGNDTQTRVDEQELFATLERVRTKVDDGDYALLAKMTEALVETIRLLSSERSAMRRLRQLFGLENCEKLDRVLGETEQGGPAAETDNPGTGESPQSPPVGKDKTPGHGRIPSSDYKNAEHIEVKHPSLAAKQSCPECGSGQLYNLRPSPVTRVFGSPLLVVKIWDCECLRCSGCQHVFTAPTPTQAQGPKFDPTAVSTIALARYGLGLPMNRLAGFQQNLETPIPASTQWEVVADAAVELQPVLGELERRAAEAPLIYIDDTGMRILELVGKRRQKLVDAGELENPERTGLFTTGLVAQLDDATVSLYRTGRNYASENLDELLAKRTNPAPPVVMSDGLDSRNTPNAEVEAANCNVHGRRHILEQLQNYPEPSRHYLRELAKVYKVEETCVKDGLSPAERLLRHQQESGPILEDLKACIEAELSDKIVEPNSGLGKAYKYLLKRWDRLTLFLRKAGVPLDNNLAERVLKMVIRHRNNSLFYATENGARVGDLYTSLIHTAILNDVNAYDYLTELMRHPEQIAEAPAQWMPWNYRDTLASIEAERNRGSATGPPPNPRPKNPARVPAAGRPNLG